MHFYFLTNSVLTTQKPDAPSESRYHHYKAAASVLDPLSLNLVEVLDNSTAIAASQEKILRSLYKKSAEEIFSDSIDKLSAAVAANWLLSNNQVLSPLSLAF